MTGPPWQAKVGRSRMSVPALVYRGPHRLELRPRPAPKSALGGPGRRHRAGVCGPTSRRVKGGHTAYAGVDRCQGTKLSGW